MKAIEPTLRARGIVVGYANRPPVLDHVDIDVLDGELTVIVGPNACGKSTLLRSLARVLALRGGRVLLDGQDIRAMNQKGVARRLGLLPQSPQAPDDMLVEELVGRGRYPYQSLVRQWSAVDDEAVAGAMRDAGVSALAGRRVGELSGGQRQRVWIAMALAQSIFCCWTSRRPTWTSITSWRCCALRNGCSARGEQSSRCCMTYTLLSATPRTWCV